MAWTVSSQCERPTWTLTCTDNFALVTLQLGALRTNQDETFTCFPFFKFRSLFDSESILVEATQVSNETLTVRIGVKLPPSVKGKGLLK